MRRRYARVVLLGLMLVAAIGCWLWLRRGRGSPGERGTPPVAIRETAGAAQAPQPKLPGTSDPESPESWSAGPFTSLSGRDIRADLDRHLMLELMAELPAGAEEGLRAKLTAFLRAYSSTDFARYLEFRPAESMCALDDPRLQPTLLAWSPQLGPPPKNVAEIVAAPWRMYIREGLGPIKAGACIDAVKWPSCRVRVRRYTEPDIIAAEWDEMLPGESHLHKEALRTAASRGAHTAVRLVVPNAVGAAELAKRDGSVLFADFDVVCRAKGTQPRRLVLRFVWDGVGRTWLPLHALVYGGSVEKPFIW